jgi:hypothetical protein
MLFSAGIALRTCRATGAILRACAESRRFPMNRVIQLPDHRLGRVWQRPHGEVFIRTTANGFPTDLLRNFRSIKFTFPFAVTLRAVCECYPISMHV